MEAGQTGKRANSFKRDTVIRMLTVQKYTFVYCVLVDTAAEILVRS